MRLDLFLTQSRLVKRRSIAKGLAEAGAVRIGEEVAKPGRQVRVGDELTVRFDRREIQIRVMALPEKRPSREKARRLVEVIAERELEETSEFPEMGEAVDFLTRR